MSLTRFVDFIAKKRDGGRFTKDDIRAIVNAITDQRAQDAQIGAWLMACYLRGLDDEETLYLTEMMRDSGETMKWSRDFQGLLVDKHSSGGISDYITLVLVPCLLSYGLKMPMISGRGLGITGGTIDKLESIPGFSTSGSPEQLLDWMQTLGGFIIAASARLAPADKIIYAARDVTATVPSIALITASILSKKSAEGLNFLVLDVKYGSGAFMKNVEDARTLARNMTRISNNMGTKTVAVVTNMNVPTGLAIGNALEVAETVKCLRGQEHGQIIDLVCELGSHALQLAGKASSLAEGRELILESLRSGRAMDCWRRLCTQHGVDAGAAAALCADEWSVLPRARHVLELRAARDGFVSRLDAMILGRVACVLGAGRAKATDVLDLAVGLQLRKHYGDPVALGDVWVEVHHNWHELPTDVVDELGAAFEVADQPPPPQPIVVDFFQ